MFNELFILRDEIDKKDEYKEFYYRKLARNWPPLINVTMAKVLYELHHDNKSLKSYRKNSLDLKQFNYPIAFAYFSKKINKHDYINMKNNQIHQFNYRPDAKEIWKKNILHLVYNSFNLVRYPISFAQLDKFARLPSMLTILERSLFPSEVQKIFKVVAY